MRLTGVRIFGFKTFAQATTFTFDAGITAIVGPNGSGKSNLVDAIRWVLGEQSAKSLRSGKTEDIIFAGNEKRRALGMAEVSITFENGDGAIPLPFKEVQVTRRAYRGGEIEYYINKDQVRLRDVHEMLMGTGLGPGSHAILSQGQVDAILTSKPIDRRALFEETSGIDRFIARKNEALRRIGDTNANLLRLNDILREVEARVPDLEAQVRRAARYHRVSARLRDVEILSAVRSVESRRQALAAAREQAQRAEAEQGAAAIAEAETEAACQALRRELLAHEEACEQARRAREEARTAFTKLEWSAAAAKKRFEALLSEQAAEEAARQRREERRGALADRIAALVAQSEPLRERAQALREREEEATLTLTEARREAERQLSTLRAFEAEVHRRSAAIHAQQLQAAHAQTEALLVEGGRDAAAAEEGATAARQSHALALSAVPEAEARLRAAASEAAACEARLHTLEELEAHLEGHLPGTRAVMEAQARGEITGMLDVVSGLITVEERYARALDSAFATSLSHIVTSHARAAEAAIEYLRSRELGRATFLPLDLMRERGGRELGRLQSIAGVIAYANDLVTVAPEYRGVIVSLVGRTLIVDTLRTAVRLAREEQVRDTIVTLEGDQLSGGGAISGGRSKRGERSLLARRAQVQSLRDLTLPSLREATVDAEADLAKAAHEAALAATVRENAQRTATEWSATLKGLRSRAESERSQMRQAEERLRQLSRRREEFPEVVAVDDDFESERQAREARIGELRAKIEATDRQVRESHAAATEARERLGAANAELEASKAQHAMLDDEARQAPAARERASSQRSELEGEILRSATERSTLQKSLESCEERVKAAQSERERVSSRIQELNERAQYERKKGRELLTGGEGARRRVAELEAELGMLESAASQQVVSEEERADVAARYAAESDGILLELPKLREDLQRLSNVNLNAEADHAQLKARDLELRRELEDLGRARELLLESIRELDESCHTRFAATFELVRVAFNEAYADLFPGGEARMWLTDPEHVNESGVEISVRPPGKKMMSLAALSGGERAMTAAALVFALIRVKPAPFYLLDEIDAALDEMNIERFSATVRNLTAHAQLLIVTHNKKTMEVAERMYGITMAEAGVSTVVSASLERESTHA